MYSEKTNKLFIPKSIINVGMVLTNHLYAKIHKETKVKGVSLNILNPVQ